MDLQLKGQHALVSGSTAGIGYAIADALAAEGAVVTINGRTAEGTERAKKKLLAEPETTKSNLGRRYLSGLVLLGSPSGHIYPFVMTATGTLNRL